MSFCNKNKSTFCCWFCLLYTREITETYILLYRPKILLFLLNVVLCLCYSILNALFCLSIIILYFSSGMMYAHNGVMCALFQMWVVICVRRRMICRHGIYARDNAASTQTEQYSSLVFGSAQIYLCACIQGVVVRILSVN